MKIFTTRSVIASGQALEAGLIYDVSEKDANTLITMGKAVDAAEAPACPPKTKAKKAKKAKVVVEETETDDGTE